MKESLPNITQTVPYDWCSRCDVCCRFPEQDSFLAPYFTSTEIMSAVNTGIDKSYFSCMSACVSDVVGRNGCKITLTPFTEGYICPAFDPASSHCKIYDVRPLDCIIYPFAIMWTAEGKEIVLGMDIKCPYVREFMEAGNLKKTAMETGAILDSSPFMDIISYNPGLVGPYQEDVTPVVVLTNLTHALTRSAPYSRGQK